MDELKRIIEDSEVCDAFLFLPEAFPYFLLKLIFKTVCKDIYMYSVCDLFLLG